MIKTIIYKTLFFSTIFALLISCEKPAETINFTIKLDAILKKSDSIHTYYMTNGTVDFNEEKSFWTKVKGNKKNQVITINFPENVLPNQFRLDFGNTLLQDDIVINKMELSYKDKKVVFKGKKIYDILRVDNTNTILDKNLGLLIRKNKKNKNGPSLYPNGDFLRLKLEQFKNKQNN